MSETEAETTPQVPQPEIAAKPIVADPLTETMRNETGHDCITCPTLVRDLAMTGRDLVHRLNAHRDGWAPWNAVEEKITAFQVALGRIESASEEHYHQISSWMRNRT